MKLTFDVAFESGKKIRVTAGPRDQLKWEQGGSGRAFGDLIARNYKIGELYSLAHAALKRQGLWDGTLQELQEQADVEIGSQETDDDDHPTQQAPTSDS
jgi:hypothetical protein